ncbi:hypothetical protein [Sabulibacter ruber]|uniref:hypothetical protein n=1 Tax=Sabulibacter ruber TaxID=2811901 RepID=UPI001A97B3D0|nr:hypothetical protein [Sabulibacter ruber]
MKRILIILALLISVSAAAEPWDKLVSGITSKSTLTELRSAKSKFYSRHDRTPLTRSLDFGYKHTVWEFDFIHGNYSTDFKISLITKNDSIIFGNLERLHWKGKVKESIKFSVDGLQLMNLVNSYNGLYLTSYSVNGFLGELTRNYYFSLGCGDTGSSRPKEAELMLKWVESKNIKKLSNWLHSPNFELQAYAIDGLIRIKEEGKAIPKSAEDTIEQLRARNSIIINCSGCLMGLQTPVNQLLFDHRKE